MTTNPPPGEERTIVPRGRILIDGAPISYIIVMAAVVTALAFIPLSVMLGSGKPFPMSQSVYGLNGWMLGPLAGAFASAIGALIGSFVAPHTAGAFWIVTIYGAAVASLAGGSMGLGGKRRFWWMAVAVLAVLSWFVYVGRMVLVNGVRPWVALATTFADWSAILLYISPMRGMVARWLKSEKATYLSLGLLLGTWSAYGISHVCNSAILNFVYNLPDSVWVTLIPIVPVEFLVRAAVGSVIGTGVIMGLRALGLYKADHAGY